MTNLNPTPTLVWLNTQTGNYDAFDATNINQMNCLNMAYYQLDFQDGVNSPVYVGYLLGSADGLTPNSAITTAECVAVVSRYAEKQSAIAAIQQSMT